MTFDAMDVESAAMPQTTATVEAPNHNWCEFVLSTINSSHINAARYSREWKHVYGVTYMSVDGDLTHTCNVNCRHWVIRPDGLKFCAISGINIDKLIEKENQTNLQQQKQQQADPFAGLFTKRTRDPVPQRNLSSPTRSSGNESQAWPPPTAGFKEKKMCRNTQGALLVAERQRELESSNVVAMVDDTCPQPVELPSGGENLSESQPVKPRGVYPGPQWAMSTATYCASGWKTLTEPDFDEASYGAGSAYLQQHDAVMA